MSGKGQGVVNIHGKNYKMVGLRIAEFRQKFTPESGWGILTELISDDFDRGVAVVKASIVDPEGRVIATGLAQDCKTDSSRHTTSWVEIAETSAIGRALGTFSAETMGSGFNIASAEEVQNAIRAEEEAKEEEQERNKINQALRECHKYFGNEVWDYVSQDLVRSAELADRRSALETLQNVMQMREGK